MLKIDRKAYKRHTYSGARKCLSRVRAGLKRFHEETSRAVVWRKEKQPTNEAASTNEAALNQNISCDDHIITPKIPKLKTYQRKKPTISNEASYHAASTSTSTGEPVINWPQPDPEIESHRLTMETVPTNCLSGISGFRIVDLKHVIQWAFLLERHRNECASSQIEFVCEVHNGFHSNLTFKCSMCDKIWKLSTAEDHKINTSFVWATVTAGSYYTQAAHITSLMNIPTMAAKKFRRIENQLGKVWSEHLTEEIKNAGEEERSIAVEKGHVTSDGVPYITVYVDGGWLKRSYGHNFDSSSGMACIIGKETKKCLYLGVRNKYCYTCQYYERRNMDVKAHGCCKNYTGPSTAMESQIIVEGFQKSEEMHKLRYLNFVGDGDSSVFANLKEKVPYGSQIKKIECKNHVIKNYTSALYKVCKRRNTTPCHNHVKEILYKRNICTKDMVYGQQNETVARSIFMQQYNKNVRPSGIFIDDEFGFLAASPDGIIDDEKAVIEIKCFPSLSRRSQSLEEAAREKKYFALQVENNLLVMNKKHDYYYQVQGQLRVTKMNKCYFICFISVTQPLTVIEVSRDDEFIYNMVSKLVIFFKTSVLPEIILRRVQKNAKCMDFTKVTVKNLPSTSTEGLQ